MNANVCHNYHCYGDEKVSGMFVDRREGLQEDMTIRSLERGEREIEVHVNFIHSCLQSTVVLSCGPALVTELYYSLWHHTDPDMT